MAENRKPAVAADLFSPSIVPFDPKDDFSKFYQKENEATLHVTTITCTTTSTTSCTSTHSTNIQDDDKIEYEPIGISPYKGFLEIWGSTESDRVRNAEHLGEGTEQEKSWNAKKWKGTEPEKFAKPDQVNRIISPSPCCTSTSQTVTTQYNQLAPGRKMIVPKRRVTELKNENGGEHTREYNREITPFLVPSRESQHVVGAKRGLDYDDNDFISKYHQNEHTSSEFENVRNQKRRLCPSGQWNGEARKEARLQRFQNDINTRETATEAHPPRRDIFEKQNIVDANANATEQSRPDFGKQEALPLLVKSPPIAANLNSSFNKFEKRRRRPIIIDGCNVAFSCEENPRFFDCHRILVCVKHFVRQGFTDVLVVVPEFRLKKRGCVDPSPLWDLKKKSMLITCWDKRLPNGRWASSYDDRMIVEIAHRRQGVIISNDRFRDLQRERPEWTETILTRVIGFRFMPGERDEIMFPSDPFGRHGPTLEEVLRF